MPLVRVDLHDHHADLRPAMSEAIHSALVEGWGMPADDLFHVFRLHAPGDLFFSRTYPDADRSDVVIIQILAYNGYTPEVKQRGAALVVDRLAALGIPRDHVLIAITENGDGDWLAPAKEA
ncbi:tautomerase family protein [Cellulomonas xiejunii]|jgi:Tautomerase enzyme|uniref:Tautomerase family protein n=1 Tax=Cellulomonas xiejunii TaxID=2968083 RepID=A0ABY5KSB9_9CELL|nr:tautomerase family protein [Cellulomonas xiejunii]MCC2321493.1 tautomerase family protein [Cellulomonas xiejunii]MCC2323355.1 tautomerase family protein [Cellulomonas xiejunii]UUI72066.1 tautomerase family protein [Cellulomonas xiejunii]